MTVEGVMALWAVLGAKLWLYEDVTILLLYVVCAILFVGKIRRSIFPDEVDIAADAASDDALPAAENDALLFIFELPESTDSFNDAVEPNWADDVGPERS